MSTRSMIAVRDHWNCPMRLFYRHCDGYPTGLGTELIEEMKKTRDVSDVLKAVCARDEQKYVSKVSEIYPGCQGDLEWIYVIDVETWSLSIIKCSNPLCNKRFNWLAWFSYVRYFPRNHRREMHHVEMQGCHILRALWRLYFLLDEKRAFGSQTRASNAYESLLLYCRDNKLDRRYSYGP